MKEDKTHIKCGPGVKDIHAGKTEPVNMYDYKREQEGNPCSLLL
jgi:hypothetical protein